MANDLDADNVPRTVNSSACFVYGEGQHMKCQIRSGSTRNAVVLLQKRKREGGGEHNDCANSENSVLALVDFRN